MALHRAIHALPPPSLKRGHRRPPGREQPPPPFKERPPSGALAQPPRASRGSPSSPPGPSTPPPSPAAAHGPARSPPRRSTTTRDPGPGAPVPSPARPPGVHPAGPVPVRFGREGTARRFPPPPPGFAPVDDARRDSSPPSGVRAPPLTVAPSAAGAPGSPADFGQPRPPLLPGQPNGDARGWAHRYPTPSRARLPTGPQPPPPPRMHTKPLLPSAPPPPSSQVAVATEVGFRSRRRADTWLRRGPPKLGGGPGLAPPSPCCMHHGVA